MLQDGVNPVTEKFFLFQFGISNTEHLTQSKYEVWNFNSGNYLFTTDTI